MKLEITTPTTVLLDADGIRSIRAEDATGWFGIHDGHADFLTALTPSVISWFDRDGRERYCALMGGVLTVEGGSRVAIATRQAFLGDDLDGLEAGLKAAVAAARDDSAAARSGAIHLEAAAIRHLQRYLEASGGGSR